jgi:hypothetical protein
MRRSFRWAAPIALAAIAIGVVLSRRPCVAEQGGGRTDHLGRPDAVGPDLGELCGGAAGSRHDRRAPAGVQRLARHARSGPQTLYGQFAGGAAYLAKAIKDKQAAYGANEATIFGGDNIGASQLASALFPRRAAEVATNLMHADFGSVGNHEFDEGSAELLRMQDGGCHPTDGCQAAPYALANGGTTSTYPVRTSSTCPRT